MKVLVVDDSVLYRTAIKTALLNNDEIETVQIASNGKIAIDFLENQTFDAITLDLEMPVMDGVEAIQEIRKFDQNIPIIIFSTQNTNSANKTLHALEMGANDFVQKIEGGTDVSASLKSIENELVPKFKALLKKRGSTLSTSSAQNKIIANVSPSKDYLDTFSPDLICIGSSTGGPETLKTIFKNLRKDIKVPILIVQHMPPVFTTQLAKTLNDISGFNVKEAEDGDVLNKGYCYIAPGDFHMELVRFDNIFKIQLNQKEKVCFVRPSVDVTLKSVSKCFTGKVATFILTGMGSDGKDGCTSLQESHLKTKIVIQDEESCVVWGMPKAVYDSGIFDDIAPLDEISKIINKLSG